jgi:hypothetical protein
MINGQQIGYAGMCSVAQSYQQQPVNVIGSIETIQHVTTGYTVQLTFNQLRLVGTNLVTQGFIPDVGNTPRDHIRSVVALPELTAVLEDQVTSTVVALIIGVKIESDSLNITSGGLWGEDVSCVARRMVLSG